MQRAIGRVPGDERQQRENHTGAQSGSQMAFCQAQLFECHVIYTLVRCKPVHVG